jgi:ATP-dependent DNA helicase PIF1
MLNSRQNERPRGHHIPEAHHPEPHHPEPRHPGSRKPTPRHAVETLLLARNPRPDNNASGSASDATPIKTEPQDPYGSAPESTPPPTEAQNSHVSVSEFMSPSSGVQHGEAGPFNPFIDNPEHGDKGPKLRYSKLDDEQKHVVDMASKEWKNICCVGSAGTGKSETCEVLMLELRDQLRPVAVVTPSGTSAVNVHAQTLHSFFGLGKESNKGIDDYIRQMRAPTKERLKRLETLVIDEISMVSYEMFDRMDQLSRAARGNDRPFGGMQLIVFGDFCQLPPVKPQEHCFQCGRERDLVTERGPGRGRTGHKVWKCIEHGDLEDSDKMWAFKSHQWDSLEFQYLLLTQVHRQVDIEFLDLLNHLRYGKPFTRKERSLLLEHPCEVKDAVELVGKRFQAQMINDNRFNRLTSVQFRYACRDYFTWKKDIHPELADIDQNLRAALYSHPYEEWVRLKLGQPVILLKNLDVVNGLVNGSQGVIIDFVSYDEAQQPRESITDRGDIAQLRRNHVMDFILGQGSPSLPIIKFNNVDTPVTIYPDCSIAERGFLKPHSLLIRTQMPLLSGWALTIHKAQGMTLEKAIVHLDHCFQSGMAYVALSRVKNLEGLKVEGLGANGVKHMVDDQVKSFMEDKFGESFD